MKCEFCGRNAKNVYETEAPFIVFSCDKKSCVKKAQDKANKWRR